MQKTNSQVLIPFQLFVEELKHYAFHPEEFPLNLQGEQSHHSALLLLGSYINTLKKHNKMEEAHSLVGELETMLGIHGQFSTLSMPN
jgi:hypothetical protein